MVDILNLALPYFVVVPIGTFSSVITLTAAMWFIQTGRLTFP